MTVDVGLGDIRALKSEPVKCLICGNPGMDFSLTDGAAVHRSCVDELQNSLLGLNPKLEVAKASHKSLVVQSQSVVAQSNKLKSEADSFTGFLRGFFGGRDYAKEIERLSKEIERLYRSIDAAEDEIDASELPVALSPRERGKKRALLTQICDFWPDYPPDWDDRREKLIDARGGRCEQCGTTNSLQAHHHTPFWRGGSNKLENLKLLCIRCHGNQHGRDFERDGFSEKQTVVSDKEELIAAAMRDGSKITFMYRKFDPKTGRPQSRGSRRTIRPANFKDVESGRREGFTRCVTGRCDLRNEDRTFAVHRMYKVQRI